MIVSERSNFPTDLYIAQGLIEQLDRGYALRLVDDPSELPAAIDENTALAMITHVNYRTGYMHDMAALTQTIHRAGTLAVWDLAHSVGAVPVDLNGVGADYAVGCTYKYLNGGPGSPAFVWVPKRHQNAFSQPLSGWWGHKKPFEMNPVYRPDDGIGRFLCGTQPIVSMSLVECGLDVFLQTDMLSLRRKSLAVGDLFIKLVEERCGAFPLSLATSREHAQRGSQVSFEHPNGYEVMQALIARGVIDDYREPRILRFGFTPLYTRFVDAWDAVETLRDVLATESWRAPPVRRARIGDLRTTIMSETKGCPFGHGAQSGEKGWHDAKLDFSDSMSTATISVSIRFSTRSVRSRRITITTRCCSSCSIR
ncbi:Kynureninase [Candidatus Paraburkholderia kirkii]|nr:Kynureninase [Candidatus Paraburkholderia kirkii]